MNIGDVTESEWYPEYAAFQIYPRFFPIVARHALMVENLNDLGRWERIAEEVYRKYRLSLAGRDDRFVYFL